MSQKLQLLRNEIDEIDEKIIKLLEQRYEIVAKVGKQKANENSICYIKPNREELIIGKLANLHNKLDKVFLQQIWRGIITASLLQEKNFEIYLLDQAMQEDDLVSLNLYFFGLVKIRRYNDIDAMLADFALNRHNVLVCKEDNREVIKLLNANKNLKIFAAIARKKQEKGLFLLAEIENKDLSETEKFFLVTSDVEKKNKEKDITIVEAKNAQIILQQGSAYLYRKIDEEEINNSDNFCEGRIVGSYRKFNFN